MQITRATDLSVLAADTLGVAYGIFNARALAAESVHAAGRALAARDRIAAEVSRRGFMVRRLSDGSYYAGPPSHFEPIP
jgi:hypothetical protein